MCHYVGHHYILISLTFPQLAHPTSQGTPIRPNSNLEPKSGQLLTNIWFNEGCSSMCHSVLHCRYTALCGLAPASALWSSLVKSGCGIPGGMKAWSMHSEAGKAKSTAWMKDSFPVMLAESCSSSSTECQLPPWWLMSLRCPHCICSASSLGWLMRDVPSVKPLCRPLWLWGLWCHWGEAVVYWNEWICYL